MQYVHTMLEKWTCRECSRAQCRLVCFRLGLSAFGAPFGKHRGGRGNTSILTELRTAFRSRDQFLQHHLATASQDFSSHKRQLCCIQIPEHPSAVLNVHEVLHTDLPLDTDATWCGLPDQKNKKTTPLTTSPCLFRVSNIAFPNQSNHAEIKSTCIFTTLHRVISVTRPRCIPAPARATGNNTSSTTFASPYRISARSSKSQLLVQPYSQTY